MNANLACENRDPPPRSRPVIDMTVPTYIWLNTVTWFFFCWTVWCAQRERYSLFYWCWRCNDTEGRFLIVFVYHSQSTAKALKRYARIPTFIDRHYHWLCSINYQPIKVRACLYVVLVGLNPCFRYSPTRGCCSDRKENPLYRCTSYPYRHRRAWIGLEKFVSRVDLCLWREMIAITMQRQDSLYTQGFVF